MNRYNRRHCDVMSLFVSVLCSYLHKTNLSTLYLISKQHRVLSRYAKRSVGISLVHRVIGARRQSAESRRPQIVMPAVHSTWKLTPLTGDVRTEFSSSVVLMSSCFSPVRSVLAYRTFGVSGGFPWLPDCDGFFVFYFRLFFTYVSISAVANSGS